MAYVFFGDPASDELSAASWTVRGTSVEKVGTSLAGPGDVDGDGLDDVLIGADESSVSTTYGGAAYLVLGGGSGAVSASSAEAVIEGSVAYDFIGEEVSGAGDVNADGYADVLVGGQYAAPARAGVALLFHGPLIGALDRTSASATIDGPEGSYVGAEIEALGDLDADGWADFAVSSYQGGGGLTHVYYGPMLTGSSDVNDADAVIAHGSYSRPYAPGDMNADGFDDLFIGESASSMLFLGAERP